MNDWRFNSPVITPDGPGLFVGVSPDHTRLLCSRRIRLDKPRPIKGGGWMEYRVEFKLYRREDVRQVVEDVV